MAAAGRRHGGGYRSNEFRDLGVSRMIKFGYLDSGYYDHRTRKKNGDDKEYYYDDRSQARGRDGVAYRGGKVRQKQEDITQRVILAVHSNDGELSDEVVVDSDHQQVTKIEKRKNHRSSKSSRDISGTDESSHLPPLVKPLSRSSNSFPNTDLQDDDDDDAYVPTPTITSSRWANDDEGEISDYEASQPLKRRRRRSAAHGATNREEGSEGTRGNSSTGSEDHARSSISDGCYYANDEMEDIMQIDGYHNHDGASVSQSDTDSEDNCGSYGTPDPAHPSCRRSVNMLQGCRSVDEFERLNKINEGTYGIVYRARDKKTGEIVALKKVKMEKEREGFPLTSLREIKILLSIHHPSIVDVKEVVMGSSLDSIFLVMEYMEHDLKGLMETIKQPFTQSEVKGLMLQLLEGISYLHDNWVLHRDLKTSNLLLNNSGEVKICDFGLARRYGSLLEPYTQLVVTLWYRAPELLLGAKQYSTAIDMWSLGCIMAELLSKEPLFEGKSELDQLDKIFRILGTPNETIWPGCTKLPGYKINFVKHQYNQLRKKFPAASFTGSPVLSDAGLDLLNKLLTFDPEKRITAEEALNHAWFREIPLPKSKEFMPTFPSQHAPDRRMRGVMKYPDPLEAQRRKELRQGGFGDVFLFDQ